MSAASRTTGTFTVQDSVYSLRVSELLAGKNPDPLIVVKYSAEYQSYYTVYDGGDIASEMDIGNKAEFSTCLASMIGRPLFETSSRYFPNPVSTRPSF